MGEMFELLKEGLESIIEYQQGKRHLRKHFVSVQKHETEYNVEDVKRIEKDIHLSKLNE